MTRPPAHLDERGLVYAPQMRYVASVMVAARAYTA